jgi:amino acid transporter
VAAIWLLTGVNVLGVRYGGGAQLLTTVLKLVPLLAIATIGLLFVKSGNFRPFNPSGQSDFHALTAAAALTCGRSSAWSRRLSQPRMSSTLSGASRARPSSARSRLP